MSRRPAKFTQADVARVIRAAKKEGAPAATIVMPDGTEFKIELSTESTPKAVEEQREVIL